MRDFLKIMLVVSLCATGAMLNTLWGIENAWIHTRVAILAEFLCWFTTFAGVAVLVAERVSRK